MKGALKGLHGDYIVNNFHQRRDTQNFMAQCALTSDSAKNIASVAIKILGSDLVLPVHICFGY